MEVASVLVLVSPELIAMLDKEWSEPVQIKIVSMSNQVRHETGATHEIVARRVVDDE